MKPRVVILGGTGVFGSQIAQGLAESGEAELILAGRERGKGDAFAAAIGASFVACDLRDVDQVRRLIAKSHLVINTSGPFQTSDYAIPTLCLEQRSHYIDIGDGRQYVAGISQLHATAEAAGVFVCVGASTAPAVTSALVKELDAKVPRPRSIKAALTAGNKNVAGVSTIATILSYAGLPVRVWQSGRWRAERGWGLGEWVVFPKPVGRRRVQLCDLPDLELFPTHFGAESVVFKAGVELTFFNLALSALAVTRRLDSRLDLPRLATPLVRISHWFKALGSYHGAVAVWVTDADAREASLALVARRNGPRVASAPAVLLARRLLRRGPPQIGAFPCLGFVTFTEVASFLAPFGIFAARGDGRGGWVNVMG